MNVVKVKSKEAIPTIQDFIINKKQGIAYCIHDEKSCFVTNKNDINIDVCKELGYTILDTKHTGGAVVVNSGDVSVIHFGEIGNNWMHSFAQYLIEQYKQYGLNATFDGNDILVDGYKISGLSATPYNHIQYSTIHIGVNTNLDDIKAICKKPMVKIPKGLSEYGLNAEQIEELLLSFCEQHK